MKRFLLILLSILGVYFVAPSAFAQLNITEAHSKVEKVGTLRSTYASLYVQETSYFLSVRSSNQFDDPFRFCLGLTAESSILTLNDLCRLCESMDTNSGMTIEDAKGLSIFLTKKKILGKPYFDMRMKGQAGISNITLDELAKARELITERVSQ